MLKKVILYNFIPLHSIIKNPYFILSGIILLGAFFRIYNLGDKALWCDEVVIYWISQGSFWQYTGSLKDVINMNAAYNGAPPLYAVVIHFISRIGDDEATLRSISYIAGIFSIPAIYMLAKKLINTKSALFTAFLVSIAPFQIEYSQELREYSLTFLFTILSIFTFYTFTKKSNKINFVLITATFSLSIFIQYGLALIILALNMIFLLNALNKKYSTRLIFKFLIVNLLVLISVYMVYNLSLKHQLVKEGFGASGYLSTAYWDGNIETLVEFLIRQTTKLFHNTFPNKYIFGFIFIAGLITSLVEKKYKFLFLIFTISLLIVVVLSCIKLYPYSGFRQNMFLFPMIYILAGLGFDKLSSYENKNLIAFILILVLGFYGITRSYNYIVKPGKNNIKLVTEELSKSYKKGDVIYIHNNAKHTFNYYYRENKDSWILGKMLNMKYLEADSQLIDFLSEKNREKNLWIVLSSLKENDHKQFLNFISRYSKYQLVTTGFGTWNKSWLYKLKKD